MRFSLIFLITIVLVSGNALAGSWSVKLSKEGEGDGKICFVDSANSQSCKEDEANLELGFVLDDEALILAQPSSGATFQKWRGDCSGKKILCKLKIKKKFGESPLKAIAVFEKK